MTPLVHLRLRSVVGAHVDRELDEPLARAVSLHLRECWWCGCDAQTHRLVRTRPPRRDDAPPSLPVARLRRLSLTREQPNPTISTATSRGLHLNPQGAI